MILGSTFGGSPHDNELFLLKGAYHSQIGTVPRACGESRRASAWPLLFMMSGRNSRSRPASCTA